MNRGQIRAVLVLISSLPFLFFACGKEEEKTVKKEVVRPIKIMSVTSARDALQRRFPGRVRASKRVELSFRVQGPLVELPVEEGQRVKEGELVARIDPRDYDANYRTIQGQLANAQASLKAMRQARPEDIRRLTADVKTAEAALKLANAEYNRIMRIKKADPGAVSQGMVDQAVEKKERAEASRNKAKEELRIGKIGARPEDIQAKEAEIKSLKAQVDFAKLQLEYTTLKAPFSGVVSRRYVDNFQEVRAKQQIVSLDDISAVEILIDVPETLMASVREGGAGAVDAVAEFAAAPGKQYPMTIKEYATRADPKTQTYQVVLQMPQPDDINVLPGMTATVTGSPERREQTEEIFVVPAIAVVADEAGNSQIWIVDKETMKVSRRPVKTGDLTGTDSIEVVEGLKSDEAIAISGVSRLREGMQVSDLSQMEGYKR
jgi:RND family efflux transporter MFP subunit